MSMETQIEKIGRGIYHTCEGVGAPEVIIKPRKEENAGDQKNPAQLLAETAGTKRGRAVSPR